MEKFIELCTVANDTTENAFRAQGQVVYHVVNDVLESRSVERLAQAKSYLDKAIFTKVLSLVKVLCSADLLDNGNVAGNGNIAVMESKGQFRFALAKAGNEVWESALDTWKAVKDCSEPHDIRAYKKIITREKKPYNIHKGDTAKLMDKLVKSFNAGTIEPAEIDAVRNVLTALNLI